MSIKTNSLPILEKPYEKLELYGEKKLTDSELLAIIIKTGTKDETAVQLAQRIIVNFLNDNLRTLGDISLEELKKIKGIGRVKAIQLKATFELAKRISKSNCNLKKIAIKKPSDVADFVMNELRYEKCEILKVIILNNKNIIQKITDVAIGGTSSIAIEPKDILIDAIKMGMPRIIVVHNHPSGNPDPSAADIEMTKRLETAAKLVGIQLLDHIVIGDGIYESIFSKYKR